MVEFYISLIMVMIACFGAGMEFIRFLYQKNKRDIYEKLKIYFEGEIK